MLINNAVSLAVSHLGMHTAFNNEGEKHYMPWLMKKCFNYAHLRTSELLDVHAIHPNERVNLYINKVKQNY